MSVGAPWWSCPPSRPPSPSISASARAEIPTHGAQGAHQGGGVRCSHDPSAHGRRRNGEDEDASAEHPRPCGRPRTLGGFMEGGGAPFPRSGGSHPSGKKTGKRRFVGVWRVFRTPRLFDVSACQPKARFLDFRAVVPTPGQGGTPPHLPPPGRAGGHPDRGEHLSAPPRSRPLALSPRRPPEPSIRGRPPSVLLVSSHPPGETR